MGILELGQKYGRQNSRQVVNAAIRAELPGGAEVVALMKKYGDLFVVAQTKPGAFSETEKSLVGQMLNDLQRVRDVMGDEIARRYGLKPKLPPQQKNGATSDAGR